MDDNSSRKAPHTAQTAQVSTQSPDADPFPFLDLPKDIRLMVYDLLCSPTIRHYVASAGQNYKLKIVKHHLETSILRVCRIINDEAVAIHKKLEALKTEPLRLMVEWHDINKPETAAVLRCASMADGLCDGDDSLLSLFPGLIRSGATLARRQNGFEQYLSTSASKPGLDAHRCIESHKELHTLLRHFSVPRTPRHIEIVVECSEKKRRTQ